MKRSSHPSFFVFAVLAVVLVGAMIHLFQLRFGSGDIYPEYSSLRADPKGARVLFESLEELPQVEARRNFRPLHRLESDDATTLLLTGVKRRLPDSTVEEIERLLENGARVVVSYYPFQEDDEHELRSLMLRPMTERAAKEEEEEEAVEDYEAVDLATNFGQTFGLKLRYEEGPDDKREDALAGIHAEKPERLPGELPEFWYSRLYLEPEDEWEIVLRQDENPVVAERPYGEGTLVVMTDSYWLSNEAMRLTRRTDFAKWILGSPRTVIFEETHLGVAVQDRLSHLMRRMNLEPLLAVLLVLAALFIWKNTAAFPPRTRVSEVEEDRDVKGHDAEKGLVNLLRANIPRRRIFSLCWEEWVKGLEPAEKSRLAPRIQAAQEIVENGRSKERDVLEDYRKVAAILNERKNAWKK